MKNDFVIGKSLKELSLEEMQLVYGGTDGADPRSTIICSATLSFIASYLGSAQTRCGKDNKKNKIFNFKNKSCSLFSSLVTNNFERGFFLKQ